MHSGQDPVVTSYLLSHQRLFTIMHKSSPPILLVTRLLPLQCKPPTYLAIQLYDTYPVQTFPMEREK